MSTSNMIQDYNEQNGYETFNVQKTKNKEEIILHNFHMDTQFQSQDFEFFSPYDFSSKI